LNGEKKVFSRQLIMFSRMYCFDLFSFLFFLGVKEFKHTSRHIALNCSHISLGSIFFKKGRLTSASTISSSASRGCRGKDAGFVLQVLMAQVRKLRVKSFIFYLFFSSLFAEEGSTLCLD